MRARLKLIATIICVVSLLGVLSACAGTNPNAIKGEVTGKIGQEYETQWFSFTVNSVEKVKEYAGKKPADGNQLLAVSIQEKNTFSRDIPIGIFDFYLDSSSFKAYLYPIKPLDDTMMPEKQELKPQEAVSYYMIYEVPEVAENLQLKYTEVADNGKEYAVFTISLSEIYAKAS